MSILRTLATAAALSTTANVALSEPASQQIEEARVITLVSSIPMAVDLAAYDLAEAAFAAEVVIDYTSLWGGEPATMTPAALMTAWRGIVPGFDATYHELSNVEVTISGDTAIATADVDGRHWIDGEVWRPIGTYLWDLERGADGWEVTRMVFDMTEEHGSRDLAAQAMERAASLHGG